MKKSIGKEKERMEIIISATKADIRFWWYLASIEGQGIKGEKHKNKNKARERQGQGIYLLSASAAIRISG